MIAPKAIGTSLGARGGSGAVTARRTSDGASSSKIAPSVPSYRVLEIAGVTILTASMGLDAMELDTL